MSLRIEKLDVAPGAVGVLVVEGEFVPLAERPGSVPHGQIACQYLQRLVDEVYPRWFEETDPSGGALPVLLKHDENAAPAEKTIAEDLARLAGHRVLAGPTGSGKSRLLRTVAVEMATLGLARGAPTILPVVVDLRSLEQHSDTGRSSSFTLDDLRAGVANTLVSSDVPRKVAHEWIESLHIVPLVDGIDHLAPGARAKALPALRESFSGGLLACGDHTVRGDSLIRDCAGYALQGLDIERVCSGLSAALMTMNHEGTTEVSEAVLHGFARLLSLPLYFNAFQESEKVRGDVFALLVGSTQERSEEVVEKCGTLLLDHHVAEILRAARQAGGRQVRVLSRVLEFQIAAERRVFSLSEAISPDHATRTRRGRVLLRVTAVLAGFAVVAAWTLLVARDDDTTAWIVVASLLTGVLITTEVSGGYHFAFIFRERSIAIALVGPLIVFAMLAGAVGSGVWLALAIWVAGLGTFSLVSRRLHQAVLVVSEGWPGLAENLAFLGYRFVGIFGFLNLLLFEFANSRGWPLLWSTLAGLALALTLVPYGFWIGVMCALTLYTMPRVRWVYPALRLLVVAAAFCALKPRYFFLAPIAAAVVIGMASLLARAVSPWGSLGSSAARFRRSLRELRQAGVLREIAPSVFVLAHDALLRPMARRLEVLEGKAVRHGT